jgi:homocitrate synthase
VLVDSTLREGEQMPGAFFRPRDRMRLAALLNEFGIDEIEVPSPVVSPSAAKELRALIALGLSAEIRPHVRCIREDVLTAIACGARGVHLFVGASPHLAAHGLREDLHATLARVEECVRLAAGRGLFVRFSAEDAFRTPRERLWPLLDAAVRAGAARLGLPDTVGVATPRQVEDLVREVRARYAHTAIEFHGHNDTGCAVANAFAAFEAGASAIDVTVLGIGERVGITSLGGFIARLLTVDPRLVGIRRLALLPLLDQTVATLAHVEVPFSNPLTSPTAFTHVAGVHANAVVSDPSSYEVLDPALFGLERSLPVASRLTGRRAVSAYAASQLGLQLDEAQARQATWAIKAAAEERRLDAREIATLIRAAAGVDQHDVLQEVC